MDENKKPNGGNEQAESDNFVSNTDNIVQTAHLILKAMREKGIKAVEVLLYEDLYPFLQENSKHQHYKDVQKEAEHHLANESLVTPDPAGLRLTQVGYKALQEKEL